MKKSTIYDDADRLMAIDEVAERLKTSPSNVARLINNGVIAAIRFGRRRYIRKVTLNAFLEKIEGKDLGKLIGSYVNFLSYTFIYVYENYLFPLVVTGFMNVLEGKYLHIFLYTFILLKTKMNGKIVAKTKAKCG